MSKHKPQPTPTPNTPPLKDEKPTLGGAARALLESKGIDPDSVTLAEDVSAEKPLSAEAATETLLSVITQRLDAVKQDGETHLQALERVIAESKVDGPVFNLGRSEGQSDVLVSVRKAFDPEDREHMTGDLAMSRTLTVLSGLHAIRQGDELPDLTAARIVQEHRDMQTALQPAFSTLGANANTRGILMSHVKGSGPDYDTGGQYQVTLVSVEDGAVRLSPLVDLGPKGSPSPVMSFGVAADHVLKRLEDFLRPKAHRS